MFQLVGLVAAFAAILVMLNRGLSLGLAMSTAVLVLALTSGLGPVGAVTTLVQGVASPDTVDLALAVIGITALSAALKHLGYLERAVFSLCDLTRSPRAVVIAAPSLVGLLPVPGGAIISAPLIDGLGSDMGLPPAVRAAVNMVFRHAWFLIFPFNPHLIVASRVAGIPLASLIAAQALPAGLCFVVGWLSLLRRARPQDCTLTDARPLAAAAVALRSLAPLLVALGSMAVLPIPLFVALLFGLLTAVALAARDRLLSALWSGLRRDGHNLDLVITVVAVMAFRAYVLAMEQLPVMVSSVLDLGVPVVLFLAAIPLVIGFISASQSTAVAVCYPLLLGTAPGAAAALGYAAMMYSFAFVGHMLSPAHPCGPLTAAYYRIPLGEMIRASLPALTATAVGSLLVMLGLGMVG